MEPTSFAVHRNDVEDALFKLFQIKRVSWQDYRVEDVERALRQAQWIPSNAFYVRYDEKFTLLFFRTNPEVEPETRERTLSKFTQLRRTLNRFLDKRGL